MFAAVRSSVVAPRILKCGGASPALMSVKSSQKMVFSPGTKVDLTAVSSGCGEDAGALGATTWACINPARINANGNRA